MLTLYGLQTLIVYSDHLGTTAHILHDNLLNATRILPPPLFTLSATSRFQPYAAEDPLALPAGDAAQQSAGVQARNPKAKIAKARLARIPRPANAFILYRKHHHQRIRGADPDVKNNDISKMVGALWAEEKKEVKDYWQRKAADLKAEHAKAYPDYQYTPRKASEKKRRASHKQRAAATEPVDPPNTKPLQLDELVPSFADQNNPDSVMHEPLPEQAGLTDQMAEMHNNSVGPSPLLPGESPPAMSMSASVDNGQGSRVLPQVQLPAVFTTQPPQPSMAAAASDEMALNDNAQDSWMMDESHLESERMLDFASMMDGNGYALAPFGTGFDEEELDFTAFFDFEGKQGDGKAN